MKRSTWVAVLVTALVLVVAGNVPRLPLDALATSWRHAVERQVAGWPRLARRATPAAPGAVVPARTAVAPAWLLATPAPPRTASHASAFGARPSLPSLPPGVALPAIAGAFAGLVTIAVFVLALRRDRRGHVWQLARRGLTPARIARSARMPQDAVRTLLTPGVGARR